MTEPLTTETRRHGENPILIVLTILTLIGALIMCALRGDQMRLERNAARAEVVDLQKQLTDLKAKPRFHADAVRFFAVSKPSRETTVVSDATVIVSDSDVPDLSRKILDWLSAHPEEVKKRGVNDLSAGIF